MISTAQRTQLNTCRGKYFFDSDDPNKYYNSLLLAVQMFCPICIYKDQSFWMMNPSKLLYGPRKTLPLGFISKMEGLQWDPANRIMKNFNFLFLSFYQALFYSFTIFKGFLTLTHKILEIFLLLKVFISSQLVLYNSYLMVLGCNFIFFITQILYIII